MRESEFGMHRQARREAMRGHPVSEEIRKKISEANTGHLHTEEFKRRMSLERGGVAIRAYPLVLRDALVEDVVQITGLTRRQVEGFITTARESGRFGRPSKEETTQRKRKAHFGKPRASRGREYTDEQKNSLAFARKCCESGLIAEDLSYWERLQGFYSVCQKPLPPFFADRLRLEVFLAARENIRKGDGRLLIAYRDIGNEVDYRWFNSGLVEEGEGFILFAIENTTGYRVDGKGLFRNTPYGISRPVNVEGGRLVFDTLTMVNRRRTGRSWKSPSGVERSKET